MTTSDAERARRNRAHKKGDHSLCSEDRCDVKREQFRASLPELDVGDGSTRAAVDSLVATLRFDTGDPRAAVSAMVLRLATEFDVRPSASIAREIRYGLSTLMEHPSEPADFVDELRARVLARHIEFVIASPSS